MFFSLKALLKKAVQASWFSVAFFVMLSGLQAREAVPVKLALIESLSGPFANTGEAVHRNLVWAVERVNQRGGVVLNSGKTPLEVVRYDNKGQVEESLSALRLAIDGGARVVMQGNSSAVAAALIDAIHKHNERMPDKRVLYLNYSAVDPSLTNERCSYWHFRFDAHADMRMAALIAVMKNDPSLRKIFLVGQDYSFGQAVLAEAKRQLQKLPNPPVVVGEVLHPIGRIKDFLPYIEKIKATGAQAVVTGNWGNDLTLLVKAAKEAGYAGKFYTFYGNALGAPSALGDAGVGKVYAVAEWMPNVSGRSSEGFYKAFRQRFPNPEDDYLHMRMQIMIEALAKALALAGFVDASALAAKLEGLSVEAFGHTATMRASDHQLQQPVVVGLMERKGAPGVPFDVEGSGFGFKVVQTFTPSQMEMASICQMVKYPQ